ncbi:MAG: acyltransferase family protein [Acidimicrobiia bacterium]|nr:acyltransferase family protein [Acidimicrobiia bacterium]
MAALDGLRGFALLGMLAWHAELEWVRGGFARMTIFFVLAGFLATRSLTRSYEHASQGRAFVRFWGRRARRLLPVPVLGVAWAVAVTAWIGGPHARERLTGDAASALFSFTNWRLILDDQPYGAMFETRSAFQHYWSLSLEEQSFLLLPLLLGVALWIGRDRVWVPLAVLGALAVALGLLPYVISMGPDTAYYGTHVRLGEFLFGVVAALALDRLRTDDIPRVALRAVGVAGAVGLAVLVATMLTVDRETEWIYQGGMVLFAVPTVAIIAAVSLRRPGVSSVLGMPPLAALGRWAFSIYVLHWPLYLLLADLLPDLDRAALVTLQLVSAIAAGAIIHHLIERPLMAGRPGMEAQSSGWPSIPGVRQLGLLIEHRPIPTLVVAVTLVLASTLLVPRGDGPIDFEAPPPPIIAQSGQGPAVAMFGGSNSFMLSSGLQAWGQDREDVSIAAGSTVPRCGLIAEDQREATNMMGGDARMEPPPSECLEPVRRWSTVAGAQEIDVAVVVASRFDLGRWQLPGRTDVVDIHHPAYQEYVRTRMADVVRAVTDAGASAVVFTTHLPPLPTGRATERERIERAAAVYTDLATEVADADPAVTVADLWTWAEGLPTNEFEALFADPVHPSAEGGERIWAEALGPHIDRLLDASGR